MSGHDAHGRLLKRVLELSQGAAEETAAQDHPDDEWLALFAAGTLPATKRGEVVEHLAWCQRCRRIVAQLLGLSADHTDQQAQPARGVSMRWQAIAWPVMALAATVVVALTISLWPSAEERTYVAAHQRLAAADFAAVEQLTAEAQSRGVDSDRLLSLRLQAALQQPAAITLAAAGRLTDLGYAIDGAVARDLSPKLAKPEVATQALERATHDRELLLNRAYLQLKRHQAAAALADFERLVSQNGDDVPALLGRGLAHFEQKNYAAAESDFRRVLALDARHIAARINLAMTLAELDRAAEALAAWQEVRTEWLNSDEQLQREQEIIRLRALVR